MKNQKNGNSSNQKLNRNKNSNLKCDRSQSQRHYRNDGVEQNDNKQSQESPSGRDYDPKNNDPSWYTTSPEMLRDVASVPFFYVSGLPVNVGTIGGASRKYTSPGVCVLYTRPSLPRTYEKEDALNAAALKQFSHFRSTISSRLPYDPSDLVMMEIGMANVYSFINYCQRAYGIMNLFRNENRYVPDTILRAMGLNPNSFRDNIANFRAWLNLYINRASALSVPANIEYFKRTAMIYSGLYTEGTSIKDQLYMYSPAGFWMYEEKIDPSNTNIVHKLVYKTLLGGLRSGDEDVGELQLVNFSDSQQMMNSIRFEQLREYGEEMLSRLYASESIGIMSANILRAYGSSGTLQLAAVPEDYTVLPVFDIGVLEQMQNATVVGDIIYNIGKTSKTQFGWDVYQVINQNKTSSTFASDRLIFQPGVYANSGKSFWSVEQNYNATALAGLDRLLTTTTTYTGPELVIESTRDMVFLDQEPAVGNDTMTGLAYPNYWVESGAECVTACVIYSLTDETNSTNVDPNRMNYGVLVQKLQFNWMINSRGFGDSGQGIIEEMTQRSTMIAPFKFRPNQYVTNLRVSQNGTEPPSVQPVPVGPDGQVDNFTIVSQSELNKMNDMVAYALFDIKLDIVKY